MASGKIKSLVRDRGFGFINPDSGGSEDVFFHSSSLSRSSSSTLRLTPATRAATARLTSVRSRARAEPTELGDLLLKLACRSAGCPRVQRWLAQSMCSEGLVVSR
jgi:hypothetical protein